MGKFPSKPAARRRQSPEGGSLASNVLSCETEPENYNVHKTKLTENLYVEFRGNKPGTNCDLSVGLRPKKSHDRINSILLQISKRIKTRTRHAAVTECKLVVDDNTQQEWTFTLYNFDSSRKTTKEDMCSLMHSMYEALEASVKQLHDRTGTLKIKLDVALSADPKNTSQIAKKAQSASPERRNYCADENIEPRNHYLDLVGIENYTSMFDDTESPQEPKHVRRALRLHPVVIKENCTGLPVHSLTSQATTTGKDKNRGKEKSCRFDGRHPASRVHQRIHRKRPHPRLRDAAFHLGSTPGGCREVFYPLQPSCGALTSQAQKHEHHHHEHLHHHHYHYQPR